MAPAAAAAWCAGAATSILRAPPCMSCSRRCTSPAGWPSKVSAYHWSITSPFARSRALKMSEPSTCSAEIRLPSCTMATVTLSSSRACTMVFQSKTGEVAPSLTAGDLMLSSCTRM